MNSSTIYIFDPIRDRLGENELIALTEACAENNVTIASKIAPEIALKELSKNSNNMLLVDVPSLVNLIEKHSFCPGEQTIVMLFERENPCFLPHLNMISGLHYMISAFNPTLLKASLSTIFRFRLEAKNTGLSENLINKIKAKSYKKKIRTSTERTQMQDAVIGFFTDQIARNQEKLVAGISSYPKYMGDILDELLMNAIWDAKETRNRSDRTVTAVLDADEQIQVEAVCDGSSFSLTVIDSQGTFPASATRKPMKYALGFRDETEINEGLGGAGLGLYMIIQKIAALSFEVESGKLTRVTAVQRGDQSLREMQKHPRTILFLLKK